MNQIFDFFLGGGGLVSFSRSGHVPKMLIKNPGI